MPAVDDDDRPKKKIVHEIGQDLTLLSAGELTERIEILKDEIARLEADMARKQAMKSAADSIFKKVSVFRHLDPQLPGLPRAESAKKSGKLL